ncbi:uncharacterized protein BDZ99DRAFT_466232 [Mytilinidion resinicola]|uniref:Uncharacterized protein n=1 Tax=Mytilinidion resinicola TaxID=574789 RepID=A0A6A6YAS9_9PEZI|nr:uncharacterized protein BDZ99DRAFT_466232 [Mytilinidion resinicola]KAF2805922.1 hypothetical protein BDZ99DRAFT_466232 [Mytilinidion resinicola]
MAMYDLYYAIYVTLNNHLYVMVGPDRAWAKDSERIKEIVLRATSLGLQICRLKQTFIPLRDILKYELQKGIGWPNHSSFEGPVGSETLLFDAEYLLEPEDENDDLLVIQNTAGDDDDGEDPNDRYWVLLSHYHGLLNRQARTPGSLSEYEEAILERLFAQIPVFQISWTMLIPTISRNANSSLICGSSLATVAHPTQL